MVAAGWPRYDENVAKADEVVYTPEIAVTGVHVDAIAGFMEDLA